MELAFSLTNLAMRGLLSVIFYVPEIFLLQQEKSREIQRRCHLKQSKKAISFITRDGFFYLYLSYFTYIN